MRILAVTNMYPSLKIPASGTFIKQQIDGLKEVGLEVDVMFAERIKDGMRVYWGIGKRVKARIEEFRPDIVHVMYGGIIADQVTKAVSSLPTVVTFHGSDLLGENLNGILRKLISSFGVRCSWRAAKRARGIIAVSEVVKKSLPKIIPSSKVKIIPCGIDTERFKPLKKNVCRETLGWNDENFHVLFPANGGDPVKRPELAKAAIKVVRDMGFQIEMHQLQGVPYDQVSVWLNASDVVLLTSSHEGSPTIIKEALACHVPIVSVDVGDVRERIEGVDECYLAKADPEDLAEKLNMVRVGPRKIMGQVKTEQFCKTEIALRLKEFYETIVSPHT